MTTQTLPDTIDHAAIRREALSPVRRVVVKVGSAVLTGTDGLNPVVLDNLARGLHFLRDKGLEVLLVSSGAVASGRKKLGLGDRKLELKEKQAAAAAGQSSLMRAYEDLFAGYGMKVAQILLTHVDLANRDRYLNIRNTIFTLLGWGVLPIINENDTVSVKELRFGDNDTLAAMIANLIEADLLVCLTDVDGLYTGNPLTDPHARLIHTVSRVSHEVERMAGQDAGALGTGGMRSKILAARTVSARGGCSFVGSGRETDLVQRLFGGELVGTFFLPRTEKMQSRKHWIAYTLRPKGSLVLDEGACRAIASRGTSLLPSGIIEVRGRFAIGDPVHCVDGKGTPIAAGLVNYASSDIERVKGAKTNQIKEILGFQDSEEIIHRDNLVLL